jgi:hypothetical protein
MVPLLSLIEVSPSFDRPLKELGEGNKKGKNNKTAKRLQKGSIPYALLRFLLFLLPP